MENRFRFLSQPYCFVKRSVHLEFFMTFKCFIASFEGLGMPVLQSLYPSRNIVLYPTPSSYFVASQVAIVFHLTEDSYCSR